MYVILATALGFIALTFFSAERALSLFSWSRLQELNAPRSRKNAAGDCLHSRGLVVTTFLVAGCLAIAALSIVLVVGVKKHWVAGLEMLFLTPLLGWILPELVAWRKGDWLALYLVPSRSCHARERASRSAVALRSPLVNAVPISCGLRRGTMRIAKPSATSDLHSSTPWLGMSEV